MTKYKLDPVAESQTEAATQGTESGERVRTFQLPCCGAYRSPEVRRELLLVAETGDWQTGPSFEDLATRISAYAGAPQAVMCGDIAGGIAALRAVVPAGPVAVLGGWVPDDVAAVLNGSARVWESLKASLPAECRFAYVPPVLADQWELCSSEDIIAWAKEYPETVIAVDERWYEYAQETVAAALHKVSNVVALRSLGPAFGLEGLNVGYLISAREGVAWQARALAQAGILPVSLRAAAVAVLDQGYMKEYVDTRLATRRWLAAKLTELGYEVTELPGPYLFVQGSFPAQMGAAPCVGSTVGGWLWAIGTPEQVEDAFGIFAATENEVKA